MVVSIGSLVTVQDGDLRDTWHVVNAGESDPTAGRISEECALAQAVLGHQAGEEVRVLGARRRWTVTILDVEAGR